MSGESQTAPGSFNAWGTTTVTVPPAQPVTEYIPVTQYPVNIKVMLNTKRHVYEATVRGVDRLEVQHELELIDDWFTQHYGQE